MSDNGNPEIWAIPTHLGVEIMRVLSTLPWYQIAPLMKELEPYAKWSQEPDGKGVEITTGRTP
jgi:hypothetical protein